MRKFTPPRRSSRLSRVFAGVWAVPQNERVAHERIGTRQRNGLSRGSGPALLSEVERPRIRRIVPSGAIHLVFAPPKRNCSRAVPSAIESLWHARGSTTGEQQDEERDTHERTHGARLWSLYVRAHAGRFLVVGKWWAGLRITIHLHGASAQGSSLHAAGKPCSSYLINAPPSSTRSGAFLNRTRH